MKILVTTTESLHGWEIETYLRPVFANVVLGAGAFSDLSASLTDFFGGRSSSYEKKLQTVKDNALNILKSKTSELGGNCILGLRVDMDQISGKNMQMFMITAYGTAVVAKSLNISKATGFSKEIDKTTIADKAALIELLSDIKKPDFKLKMDSLQFIVDSKSSDFKEYIFSNLKSYIAAVNPIDESYDQVVKLYTEYFSSIESADAITVLYSDIIAGTEAKILKKILEIIKLYDLVDYDYCIKMLSSDSLFIRKSALYILHCEKPFYIFEDIDKINTIIGLIDNSFPIRASLSTKKGFLSSNEKEIWVCECGKSNSIDDLYCSGCSNDKYGFKLNEVMPDKTLNVLNNKVLALKELFNA